MKQHSMTIRVGGALIVLAVVLRLCSSGFFDPLVAFFRNQGVASFLLFLETGRVATADKPATEQPDVPIQPTTQPSYQPQEQVIPAFRPEDALLVDISRLEGYGVDVNAMLQAPLQWQLQNEAPTVLILHSHATESYTPTQTEPYIQSSSYRTLDETHNMLRVGTHLTQLLEAAGIGVIHDKTLHDHPDYNSAYAASRKTVQQYLAEYPSICLVLDLHRDAAEVTSKHQLTTHATVSGADSAQLMFVIGTDGTGLNHPKWQDNMALAVKLQVSLEKQYPGICRPINFRAQRFNQDLSTGAMIVEVGAAGDTLEEALVAVEALAQSIVALSHGTTSNSTS